jgi:Flp pilus assembly protein TadD
VSKPTTKHADWLKRMDTGTLSFRKGRPKEAAGAFRRAVELQPQRNEGWINLGSALLECAQYEDAAHALQQAIAIDPDIMIPHMLLGDALRMLGRRKPSIESYSRAVALQRSPMALNKLACALRSRSKFEEAEALYFEAQRRDPAFTLARVNRATMQIERHRYDEARQQLELLEQQTLPRQEQQEVAGALDCIAEHARLSDAIDALARHGDLDTLRSRLAAIPAAQLRADRAALASVEAYAGRARGVGDAPALPAIALPDEWPLIEAMHMIPLVHSVDEYVSVAASAPFAENPEPRVLESLNMAPAIRAARLCRDDMADPVRAEVNLRHWHALAASGIEGFSPGHFKYTRNWVVRNPTLPRVTPHQCSGTMRYFISEIYGTLPPGLLRATVAFLGLLDPHPFADGNARIAMIWLNRELEWAGLMPALFPTDLGLKGQLSPALAQARNNKEGVGQLLAVIARAQRYARDFCIELAEYRRESK